jgi:pimeloyl-ACP methyl ester carboxylesterase
MNRRHLLALAVTPALLPTAGLGPDAALAGSEPASEAPRHRSVTVDGVEIFYREAGPAAAPALLLLHGYPTSSHMFRNLIPTLAARYRVVAPDYPGFGYSAAPGRGRFTYSFDTFARLIERFTETVGLSRYALYVMDYGAPVGFRLATAHPERVTALVVQNGNAYAEGLESSFWDPIRAYWKTGAAAEREALRQFTTPAATRWQYTDGVADPSRLSPDAWTLDQLGLDRPGNAEIQLDLFYDYRTNPPLYPAWQAYFRQHRPPTLVVWGRNDTIFPAAGAQAYRRDNPEAELHLLDTGHFALETHGAEIAALMRDFLARKLRAG